MASKQRARRGGTACSAINCTNRRFTCPGKSFFSFPKDKARCKEWVQRSRRQDLLNKDVAKLYRNCHLCSDHFEESQFMNAQEKKRLIWNAVPSVFNVPNPPPSVTPKRRLPGRKPVDRSSSSAKKSKLIGPSGGLHRLIPRSLPTKFMQCNSMENPKPETKLRLPKAGCGSSSDEMDSNDPLEMSVVKIEIDIAEEPPVCRWTETDHKDKIETTQGWLWLQQ